MGFFVCNISVVYPLQDLLPKITFKQLLQNDPNITSQFLISSGFIDLRIANFLGYFC